MSRFAAPAAAVAVASLLGCRGPREADAARPGPAYSASLRVRAQDAAGQRQSAHGFLAVAAPDRLRLELLDPVGRTRLVAIVATGRSTVVTADAFADADRGRDVLEALGHPGVEPRQLVELLLSRGSDAGRVGDGVAYRREPSPEGPWPRRLELTSSAGTMDLRLGDAAAISGASAFQPLPTEGLSRRPLRELLDAWGEPPGTS